MALWKLNHFRLGDTATKEDFPKGTSFSRELNAWLYVGTLDKIYKEGFGIQTIKTAVGDVPSIFVSKNGFGR